MRCGLRKCAFVNVIFVYNVNTALVKWFPVAMAWRVLRLRIEMIRPLYMDDSCEYIATRLRAGQSGFDSRQGLGIILFATASRSALGLFPASNPMDTGSSFLGVKRSGLETDHSPPSSAKVKKAWNYTSTPPLRPHGVVLS